MEIIYTYWSGCVVLDKILTLKIIVLGEPYGYKEDLCRAYSDSESEKGLSWARIYYKSDRFNIEGTDISVMWIIHCAFDDVVLREDMKIISRTYLESMDGTMIVFDLEDPNAPDTMPRLVKKFWDISGIAPFVCVGIYGNEKNIAKNRELIIQYLKKASQIIGIDLALFAISNDFRFEAIRKTFSQLLSIVLRY